MSKKGFGISENSAEKTLQGSPVSAALDTNTLLNDLGVSWFYNWGVKTNTKTTTEFVPLAFSDTSVNSIPANSPYALGFNEPDGTKPGQADMTVGRAITSWPNLRLKATKLGSPALAGNSVSWLSSFLADSTSPQVDFIAFHWYGPAGPSAPQSGISGVATSFASEVNNVCQKYGKPVWVTEFAAQTHADSVSNPGKYSQQDINKFISTTVEFLNSSSCVQRYAYHDSEVGSSALYDRTSGKLTATGVTYKNSK